MPGKINVLRMTATYGATSIRSVPEEREKDDNRDWDAQQPKQNSSTHWMRSLYWSGVENAVSPRTVPQRAAFDSR
jgi:hypothetical protein